MSKKELNQETSEQARRWRLILGAAKAQEQAGDGGDGTGDQSLQGEDIMAVYEDRKKMFTEFF